MIGEKPIKEDKIRMRAKNFDMKHMFLSRLNLRNAFNPERCA
jgi:hypothetical protein